ncbi:uncharacterized protein K02A2.6-like [Anoplophora glabripennis]|nr:uncharacterized protein K02A2.6-like [Anoplophora glabripennis]
MFMEEVFARYGYPASIITDAARLYQSVKWTHYMETNHIQGYTAPVYHQRANPVERRIQELKKTIRALVIERPARWQEALPEALFALRTRTNAATGASPAMLLFGQNIRRPGDWVIPEAARPPPEPRNERLARARRRQEVYQRNLFPEPREAPRHYQRGDLVLTKTRPGNPPFAPKWSGPYPIVEVLGDGVYVVDQNGNAQPIHVDDLRTPPPPRANDMDEAPADPPEPGEPDDDGTASRIGDEDDVVVHPEPLPDIPARVELPSRPTTPTSPQPSCSVPHEPLYRTRVWHPSTRPPPQPGGRPRRRRSVMVIVSPTASRSSPNFEPSTSASDAAHAEPPDDPDPNIASTSTYGEV